MILVRTVFHAKQGGITRLVDAFKQMTENVPNRPTILTDLSGPMNTMILEMRHASLAAYEQWRAEMFRSMPAADAQGDRQELFESGAIEFYTIEQG